MNATSFLFSFTINRINIYIHVCIHIRATESASAGQRASICLSFWHDCKTVIIQNIWRYIYVSQLANRTRILISGFQFHRHHFQFSLFVFRFCFVFISLTKRSKQPTNKPLFFFGLGFQVIRDVVTSWMCSFRECTRLIYRHTRFKN